MADNQNKAPENSGAIFPVCGTLKQLKEKVIELGYDEKDVIFQNVGPKLELWTCILRENKDGLETI